FQPYDEHAPGGLAVGAGDVTGLNGTNLITSPGAGTQPRLVKVFNAEVATVLTINVDAGVGSRIGAAPTPSVASGCIDSFFPCPVAAPPPTGQDPAPPPVSTNFMVVAGQDRPGTVQSAGGEILCGDTCAHSYLGGSAVALSAAGLAGMKFAEWTGCDPGTSGPQCALGPLGGTRYPTALFTNVAIHLGLTPNHFS